MQKRVDRIRLWCGVLLVAAWCAPHVVQAQSARLHGFVSDAETGRPMELVNVLVTSADGELQTGTVTGGDGSYVFPSLAPGRRIVQASFVGFHTFRDTLDLAAGDVRALNIDLRPDAAALDEVVVQGEVPAGLAAVTAGERVEIPLNNDRQEMREMLEEFGRWQVTYGIVIERIMLRTVATDPDWRPPGGAFDPEVLIDPNAMTNVENGFGFVGSGYELAMPAFHSPSVYGEDAPKTVLTAETLLRAGFVLKEPHLPQSESCVGAWPPTEG